MKLKNEYQEEEIDVAKTLSYIFASLIITIIAASVFIIPNIQQLKVLKIYASRSLVLLKNSREYKDELLEKHKKLSKQNIKFLEALKVPFREKRFEKFSKSVLENFKIKSLQKKEYKDIFYKYEINATAKISDLKYLYEYIDKINKYENLVSISFPMNINSNKDYSLDIDFTINIYELHKKE